MIAHGEASTEVSVRPIAVEHARLADTEAERAVLAAVILDGSYEAQILERVARILRPEDFTDPAHAEVFAASLALRATGTPIDVYTLTRELTARRRLNAVGGAQFIGDLTDDIPTQAHALAHAMIVAEHAVRRRLDVLGAALRRRAHDLSTSLVDVRDGCVSALRAVSIPGAQALTLGDDLVPLWARMERVAAGEVASHVATDVPGLDRILGGGFIPGNVYLLAARPRVGKTALAMQTGINIALRGGVVFMVSLEIGAQDLARQSVACLGRVDHSRFAAAQLTQDEIDRAAAASDRLASLPFYRVEPTTPGCPRTVSAVGAAMMALPSPPSLVIVDHVGKIEPRGRHREKRHALAEVSQDLIMLARQTGVPLLVLAHINRDGSDAPSLDNLAEADQLGQDADGVIIMHRPDLVPPPKRSRDDGPMAEPGVALVSAAKVRGNALGGLCRMRLRGEWQRWEPMDVDAMDDGGEAW